MKISEKIAKVRFNYHLIKCSIWASLYQKRICSMKTFSRESWYHHEKAFRAFSRMSDKDRKEVEEKREDLRMVWEES